jgi:hypothetical protein
MARISRAAHCGSDRHTIAGNYREVVTREVQPTPEYQGQN